MKHLLTCLLLTSTLVLLGAGCTTAQKNEAKQIAIQIAKDVGKEASILTATAAVEVAAIKLEEARVKLVALRAATDPKDLKAVLKLRGQEALVEQADKLLVKANELLEKLKGLDTQPAAVPVELPPVTTEAAPLT